MKEKESGSLITHALQNEEFMISLILSPVTFLGLFLNYDQLTYKYLLRSEYAVKSLATVYPG